MLNVLHDPGRLFLSTVPAATASYVVFEWAGKYYAKNCKTGEIEFSGSDATAVMQAAINALPKTADDMYIGKILLKEGIFNGKGLIDIPKYSQIWIQGSGLHNTVLKISNTGITSFAERNCVFRYESDNQVMDAPSYAPPQEVKSLAQYLRISDLTIDTVDENYVGGIYVLRPAITDFENLRIYGYYSLTTRTPYLPTGPYIKGIMYDKAYSNIQHSIRNVLASGFYSGVRLMGDHYHVDSLISMRNYMGLQISRIVCSVITKFHTYQSNRFGIVFDGESFNSTIINPGVEGVVRSDGYQYYVSDVTLTNVEVRNPRFYGANPKLGGYYKRLKWTGFGFQNSGTATIAAGATSVTVAHGLVETPTVVKVTSRGNIGAVWVSARGATNITISCATAPTADTIVDWEAEI